MRFLETCCSYNQNFLNGSPSFFSFLLFLFDELHQLRQHRPSLLLTLWFPLQAKQSDGIQR